MQTRERCPRQSVFGPFMASQQSLRPGGSYCRRIKVLLGPPRMVARAAYAAASRTAACATLVRLPIQLLVNIAARCHLDQVPRRQASRQGCSHTTAIDRRGRSAHPEPSPYHRYRCWPSLTPNGPDPAIDDGQRDSEAATMSSGRVVSLMFLFVQAVVRIYTVNRSRINIRRS